MCVACYVRFGFVLCAVVCESYACCVFCALHVLCGVCVERYAFRVVSVVSVCVA